MRKLPVILVSGWAHGVDALGAIAEPLANTHPVCSLSLTELLMEAKEKDRAADSGNGFEISPYARAIEERIRNTDGPVCIIGWSTGGMAALEAASICREKVGALVLLSSTARFCSEAGYDSGTPQTAVRAMSRGMRRDPEAVLRDFFLRACLPEGIPGEELERKIRSALDIGIDPLIHGLDYLMHFDLRHRLRAIAIPCLAIHGEEDQIIPPGASQFLGRNLPHSAVFCLPGAGHTLIEQYNTDIVHRIEGFMEGLS